VRRRELLAGLLALPFAAQATPGGTRSADTVLSAPDGRRVSVRVVWPAAARGPVPLVLLSHGANGTLDGLVHLQTGLARGAIVAAPLHPDSESNPDLAKVDRATLFATRIADMRLVADSIPALEALTGARIDKDRIAAAGHSYGALVAQALGGAEVASPGGPMQAWRDPRVRAVVAFSPPGPVAPFFTREGWAKLAVPQFVQTGTADVLPMIAPQWEAHMASYEAAAVPGSMLWVGVGVDHYFGNRIQRLAREAPDQSAAFAAALDAAGDFIAARVSGDRRAARRLAVLRPGGPLHRVELRP